MEKQVIPTSLGIIGNTGLRTNNGVIYEDFIPQLQMPYCLDIYDEMSKNDPVIGAILFCVRQLIKNVTWMSKPGSESRKAKLAAEFIKENLDDQSLTWNDIIEDMTSCFEYGWAYSEVCYKKRMGYSKDPKKNSKYDDGLIGWRKISGRSQQSWSQWEIDEESDNGIKGMWQNINTSPYKVFIPIEKSLLIRTSAIRNNPEVGHF